MRERADKPVSLQSNASALVCPWTCRPCVHVLGKAMLVQVQTERPQDQAHQSADADSSSRSWGHLHVRRRHLVSEVFPSDQGARLLSSLRQQGFCPLYVSKASALSTSARLVSSLRQQGESRCGNRRARAPVPAWP
eukprot:6210415-Pleurochrysis_carterae.AAC.1